MNINKGCLLNNNITLQQLSKLYVGVTKAENVLVW